MTPLRCLIVDDEPLAHKIILEYAKETPFLEIVGQCYLATEALSFLNKTQVDLIFLDIQMPKLTGLEFLRTLAKKPQVIITSAYKEYALESFELDVCDYLLKPFRFDRFLKAVNKAVELHQFKNQETILSPAPPVEPEPQENFKLFIKADKRQIQIDMRDIHYLESHGNYVKVWINDKFHLTPSTLSGFAALVPESLFFRIHKSYHINRLHINYIEGNFVVMKNGVNLSIGKNHRQEFKQFIGKNT